MTYIDESNGQQSLLGKQRLDAARKAFFENDIDASRLAHQSIHVNNYRELHGHDEHHNSTSSDYLKAIVFGGLDGIVTIFAIVAGSVGVNLNPLTILIIGLGNLFADAVSMAFGEYVSASAEDSFTKMEQDREEWEMENCPEDEKQEMIKIYTERHNFSLEDAQAYVNIGFKYQKFFIHHMMVEELGILLETEKSTTPLKRALVMFISFCLFGLIPLGGFIVYELILNTNGHASSNSLIGFLVAIVSSLITLFILGAFKGWFVNQNFLKSGVLMVLNGSIAGSIAYAIGSILGKLSGQ